MDMSCGRGTNMENKTNQRLAQINTNRDAKYCVSTIHNFKTRTCLLNLWETE